MTIKKIKRLILLSLLTLTILPFGARDMAHGTDTPAPAAPPAAAQPPQQPTPPPGMALVPQGQFVMGCARSRYQRMCDKDEFPAHTINLSAYFIDVTEVTNEAYSKCVATGKCSKVQPRPRFDEPQQPVGGVSWYQANDYCSWAGKRLPTESEWEKAARGTDQRAYPWGNQTPTCERAIFHEKKKGDEGCSKGTTWPVGSKPEGRSPYGVYDMAGNVWEWVNDWYSVDYYRWGSADNPKGPEIGQYRIFRGGAWESPWYYVRSSYRVKMMPEYQHHHIGFRCAKSI